MLFSKHSCLILTIVLGTRQVVEVISTAIGDMMRGEFTALRNCHGNGIVLPDGVSIPDWEQQTFLASGSLISSSCKAALMLAHHSDALQQQAYEFGRQIALAYQVCVVFITALLCGVISCVGRLAMLLVMCHYCATCMRHICNTDILSGRLFCQCGGSQHALISSSLMAE